LKKPIAETNNIKILAMPLEGHTLFKFKQRCLFYELTMQEVASLLIAKFLDGEFDEELGIDSLK
jgi:hypothetical protein